MNPQIHITVILILFTMKPAMNCGSITSGRKTLRVEHRRSFAELKSDIMPHPVHILLGTMNFVFRVIINMICSLLPSFAARMAIG